MEGAKYIIITKEGSTFNGDSVIIEIYVQICKRMKCLTGKIEPGK